ncbi:MAG: ABC transporter ATP-binding protein [Terriglobales bacterium]
MIELTNLRKEFDDLVAVENLTLSISSGEIYGLIGPNGAGKTTTIRMMCGLLEPTQGKVRVAGIDVLGEPERARQYIGYLSDFFSVYEYLKVWEYLDYFAHAYKMPELEIPVRVSEVIAQAGLEVKRDDMIRGLSRGMKQRLGIARAMIHRPKVLVLDEPASGLDPKARIELRNLLRSAREEGATILISSHILTELEGFCTSIGIMEKGRLVRSGRLEEVMLAATPTRTVRLQWLGEGRAQIEARLGPLATVSEMKLSENEGEFIFSGSDNELSQALADLITSGARILSFREVKQTVEEMYMKLSTHEVM